MPSAIAPSTDNLSILKGIMSFQEEGTSGYRHMGNAPSIELTFDIEELEHKTAMEGISDVDLTVVISRGATIVVSLEEWDMDNVEMAVLGTALSGGAIQILATDAKRGALRVVGTNTVGVRMQWDFPLVSFRPSGSVPLISEEFAAMELTGRVLTSGGSFGTVEEILV